eukprot:3164289-Pyramimonas_sp.AAC.1
MNHEQAFRTLRRIKQCKANTLLTGKRRYAYKLQDTPYCALCQRDGREQVVSNITHIRVLGGCPNGALRKLHCVKHDQAVGRRYHNNKHA